MSRAIDPGQLSERLILSRPVTTLDAMGGSNVTYVVEDTIWAALDGTGAADLSLRQQQPLADAQYRFLIRRNNRVTTGWAVSWRGETYYVLDRTILTDPTYVAITVKKRSGA